MNRKILDKTDYRDIFEEQGEESIRKYIEHKTYDEWEME